jgi:hypothetical protein
MQKQGGSMSTLSKLVWIAALLLASSKVQAAVERIEVKERSAFAPGVSFGEAGAYEKIRGVAYFALDPKAAANAAIVDLKLAPRDARGLVLFSSELVLLRPSSGRPTTMIYDVNNRGGIAMLGQINGRSPLNNDPTRRARVSADI